MSPKRISDKDVKIKHIFKKVFSTKKKKDKEEDGGLVFDAVPDAPRADQPTLDQSGTTRNASSAKPHVSDEGEHKPEDDNQFDDKIPSFKHHEFDTHFFPNGKKTKGRNEKAHNYGVINQSHVVVYNGTNVHVGTNNTYNVIPHVNYGRKPQEPKQAKKAQMTKEIKELLHSEDKLGRSHLQFLSCHFKEEWIQIAVFLGLTFDEIKNIKKQYNNFDEAAFQMLQFWWCDKRGEDVMVGELAGQLWNSQIAAAQDAVRDLSVNMDNFNP